MVFGGGRFLSKNAECPYPPDPIPLLAVRLALNGPVRVGGAQDLNFTSAVPPASATREIEVTNTGVTTIGGVLSPGLTRRAVPAPAEEPGWGQKIRVSSGLIRG